MGLLEHQGPFEVGAIDLEIPARDPRSFATDIVSPDQINRPSKRAQRDQKQPSAGDEKGSKGQKSGKSSWSPLHHGSKTSTLHLSTVLFTIWYPTSHKRHDLKKHHGRVAWLGRPKRKGIGGLIQYMGQYGVAGPFAAVPASPALGTLLSAKAHVYAGAPLADSNDERAQAPPPDNRIASGLFGQEPFRFPVIIFSHGLAGSRLAYSQLCGELASHGVVVASIEHRDGSGISSVVRPPVDPRLSRQNQNAEQATNAEYKKARHNPKLGVPYFDFSTVGLRSFPTDPNEEEIGMRQAQLAMRCAEIDECLHVLKRIAQGEGEAVAKESTRTPTTKLCGRSRRKKGLPGSLTSEGSTLSQWKGRLDMDFPALAGHSFGGATVMEYLRREEAPFPYGLLLDPWVEPVIIDEKQSRPLRTPVYVINSESFTIWNEHFEKVKKLVGDAQRANRENRGWVVTLTGSEHLSFSDFPLLLPRIFRSTVTPSCAIEIYTCACLMQTGLLRQSFRERAGKPGHKFGGTEELKREAKKDETLGAGKAPNQDDGKQVNGQPNDGDENSGSEKQEAHTFAERERGNVQRVVSSAVQAGKDPVHGGDRQQLGNEEDESQERSGPKRTSSQESSKQPEEGKFPQADRSRYDEQLQVTEDPTHKEGEERERAMDRLRDAKDNAAEALLNRKNGKKHESHQNGRDGEHAHPNGVVAYRTPSGGMSAKPRSSQDRADFAISLGDDDDRSSTFNQDLDPDVQVVHASLQDLSASQQHKKYRLRSVMGLLYLSYGMRPGLGPPGSVLVHDLRGKSDDNGDGGKGKAES